MDHSSPSDSSLKKLRALVTDVDGVLTNAVKYYGLSGPELLGFNVRDGLGLYLLKRAGMHLAFVTTTDSDIISKRAFDLEITDVYLNVHDKRSVLRGYRQKYNLQPDEIIYIGDDLWDLEAFKEVGIRVAVADAAKAVKEAADWVTEASGGNGALREIANALLKAKDIDPMSLLLI